MILSDEPESAEVFRLRKVPSSLMPYSRGEDVMRLFSAPFLVYAPMMIAMMVAQYFVPAPRIGVETLWDSGLRTIIGLVAIAPSMIVGIVRTRQEYKHKYAPTLYVKEIAFSAVFGALLAGLVAWSLGAPMTPVFATIAFFLTLMWIGVTGIVAVFISGSIRLKLLRNRLKRAESLGIDVPFNVSARMW
jgi:hypothetical protein